MGQDSGVILPHPRYPGNRHAVILGGFVTGSAVLGSLHAKWLTREALPHLRNHGWVWIRGFASRIAGEAYNLDLSVRRAEAIRRFLLQNGVDPSHITGTSGVGEAWSSGGEGDNSPEWRSVEVILTPQRITPPPPPDRRPSRSRRFGWREVHTTDQEPPLWSLAGRDDTPAEGSGDALSALVQFASRAFNSLSVRVRIQRELGRETTLARQVMTGHALGGVLAVATCDVRNDGTLSGETVLSVGIVNSTVFSRPCDAISRWRRTPSLETPSQRQGGSLAHYFFWGTWMPQ